MEEEVKVLLGRRYQKTIFTFKWQDGSREDTFSHHFLVSDMLLCDFSPVGARGPIFDASAMAVVAALRDLRAIRDVEGSSNPGKRYASAPETDARALEQFLLCGS